MPALCVQVGARACCRRLCVRPGAHAASHPTVGPGTKGTSSRLLWGTHLVPVSGHSPPHLTSELRRLQVPLLSEKNADLAARLRERESECRRLEGEVARWQAALQISDRRRRPLLGSCGAAADPGPQAAGTDLSAAATWTRRPTRGPCQWASSSLSPDQTTVTHWQPHGKVQFRPFCARWPTVTHQAAACAFSHLGARGGGFCWNGEAARGGGGGGGGGGGVGALGPGGLYPAPRWARGA